MSDVQDNTFIHTFKLICVHGVCTCMYIKKVYGNIKAYCCEINETRLKIQRFVSYKC